MHTKFLKDTTDKKMTRFVTCHHTAFNKSPETVNSLT